MPERFFQDTIALVYDFDGTLSPQPMQEYTVLPKIGVEPSQFWARVSREARETESDPMLVYMRHIIEALEVAKVDVKREDLAAMARKIVYFPGVTTWFSRMNAYVKKRSRGQAKVLHYLISAGQREILEGVSIRKHFKRIYASEYHFNHHGVATFPKFLVTDTLKTQFLFRINKGLEAVTESINEHMPEAKRAGRVDFIAAADFRRESKLSRRVELLLDAIVADIAYRREAFHVRMENRGRK